MNERLSFILISLFAAFLTDQLRTANELSSKSGVGMRIRQAGGVGEPVTITKMLREKPSFDLKAFLFSCYAA